MRRTALVMVLLAGIGCTSVAPTPTPAPVSFAVPTSEPSAYGEECRQFQPTPSDTFIEPSTTPYRDDSVLEWPVGTPQDVGLDSRLIERVADDAGLSTDVRSLLIVKDGRLVTERYYNGADASDAYGIHSVSKSILGLLTGIAIEDGLLALDTTIGEVLPENLVGEHPDLTVENLLTMSAGLQLRANEVAYDEDVASSLPGEPSFVRAVLARPSVDPPGTKFDYSTGLTQVLAAVLTEVTGQTVCEYASNKLLGPVGIDVDWWWIEPDGYFAGGHSVFLTPRELAQFGQLVLEHGEWGGKQLVPEEWLDQSLSERWDLGCRNTRPMHQGYGYLWWIYDMDGYTVWNASGYGGQEIWLVPELGLNVVVTHDIGNTGQPDNHQVGPWAVVRAAITDALPPKGSPACSSQQFTAVDIDPDGGSRLTIEQWPEGALASSWSPDQERLAVAYDRVDLNSEIYTFTPTGSGEIRLTYDFGSDLMPAWSPAGDRIAYVHGDPGSTDIFTVTTSDVGERAYAQVTDLEGYEEAPTWSPDSTRIAFVWGQEDVRGFGSSGELWAMDSDGSNHVRLLQQQIGYPAWSPEGNRIALEIRGGEPRIGILDLESGELADLGPGYLPKWSPDGQRITFVREAFSSFEIFVLNSDGTNEVRLTDDSAFDTFPIWSPDGGTIRFMTRGGEQ